MDTAINGCVEMSKEIIQDKIQDSDDDIHQYIISEGTTLTVYNYGTVKNNQNQNICLAFTVDDIDKEYEKVLSLGARIIEPPAKRPWGVINMSFYDPDNNIVYLRSFPKNAKEF